ncbi:MAG TPA: biotin--[acetyl-CoA-carboxylase] ligase [Flavisolibacter sp.]
MKHKIGTPFIELPTVDSTNNYATTLAHEGMARHGTAVFAHRQTRGRGQRTKEWVTGGGNIALSLVLEPVQLTTSRMFSLSMAVALGACRFFTRYAGEDTRIKWPNDIYWRDRKAGGILIENILQGSSWRFAVAGIGLNINQDDFGELNNRAVSLKQITGRNFSSVILAHELCSDLQQAWDLLEKDQPELTAAYHSLLYKLNEPIRLKKENRVFEALLTGVTLTGQLVVRHSIEEQFDVGEVEWIFEE